MEYLQAPRITINKPSHDDVIPLKTINNNQTWEVVSLESTVAGDGCLVRWMTPASSTHWWSGVWGTNVNEFNIWFNYKGLSNKPTGDVAISGNLNVAGRILIDGPHLNVQPKSSTSSETLVFYQPMSSEFGSDSHGINIYGRQGGNSHLKFYNSRSGSVCNVVTDGNIDVGATGNNSIEIHGT